MHQLLTKFAVLMVRTIAGGREKGVCSFVEVIVCNRVSKASLSLSGLWYYLLTLTLTRTFSQIGLYHELAKFK